MLQTRRESLGLIATGAMTLVTGGALAQAPAMSPADRKLLRSVENAPWIASGSNAAKPVYVLWAPWCPYCQQVMRDAVAGAHADIQLRWIGSSARSPDQRLSIASIAKTGSADMLRQVLLREPMQPVALTDTYVDQVLSAELVFIPLQDRNARGYPTFVYVNGQQVATHSGYGGAQSLATVTAQAAPTTVTRPDTSYLDEPWTDLGPASGRPHQSANEYTIYSLPNENSVAVKVVQRGMMWPAPTKRTIGVRNQRWVSVTTGIRFGNGPELDGYIRLS